MGQKPINEGRQMASKIKVVKTRQYTMFPRGVLSFFQIKENGKNVFFFGESITNVTIKEIRNILRVWTKTYHTPLGKTLVIKTLAVSKITHLFISLPDPPEQFMHELDALLFQFLWDSKRDRSFQIFCL